MSNGSTERRGSERGALRIVGDGLYTVLRFIARHVRGFYGAVITYLSFAFFVALGAVFGFVAVADQMLEGATQQVDEAVLTWVEASRSHAMDRVALQVTALGNTATLAVLVLFVSMFLWLTRHRLSVALLLIAVAGGGLLNALLKNLFDRPRPSVVDMVTEVTSYSFPSGHSMGAAVAYASMAYLGGRLEPSARLRWGTWVFAGVIIVAIGLSRVYLGVHYPSDVLAGWIAGVAWTAFVVSGLAAMRYFSRRKPEVEEEEKDLHAEEEREAGLRT